jgi:uncharacterized membrane protein YfcA
MSVYDKWSLFETNWFMSITMMFGSFIAGATSEGGGAVAFPVMTLLFEISPRVARDFSLLIQSVGMTAAASYILRQGIPIERNAVKWAGLGGAVGILVSLEWIAPHLPPLYTKVFFVSLWLSFGVALYRMNREATRHVFPGISEFQRADAHILLLTGVVGGVVSGLTGSGLDIVTFSVLVLAFRIDEKIATPTSVVLMASNTLVGAFWLGTVRGNIEPEAWSFWLVCVPIVVVGAPLGAWFIKTRSRMFVVAILYASITAQYLGALLILPQTPYLLLFNFLVLSGGLTFFGKLTWVGTGRESRKVFGPVP